MTDTSIHVFRTLQNNNVYYLAICKLLKHFGWTWVGIFQSDDDSAEDDKKILTKLLSDHGICVAFITKMVFREWIDYKKYTILNFKKSQVVIFCGIFTGKIAMYLSQHNIPQKNIVFIFLPSWISGEFFAYIQFNANAAYLAVEHFSFVIPGFEKMFDHEQMSKYSEMRFVENWVVKLYCGSSSQKEKCDYLKNITSFAWILDAEHEQVVLK